MRPNFCIIHKIDLPHNPDNIMDIEEGKPVYLFTHGRRDLREKALAVLTGAGFASSTVVDAAPDKVGDVGDYMAMLWAPHNPDHIKIQRITRVEAVEPQGMIGLWKGVSKDEIGTISL